MRGLQGHAASGRPSKLLPRQQNALLRLLKKGARRGGFPTERWTLPRVQQVIQREFGVSYHPKYLGRLLRRLGWSPQIPLPRAVERDEDLVLAFLQHDWGRIKKSAAARRRYRGL
jgi:transposase